MTRPSLNLLSGISLEEIKKKRVRDDRLQIGMEESVEGTGKESCRASCIYERATGYPVSSGEN